MYIGIYTYIQMTNNILISQLESHKWLFYLKCLILYYFVFFLKHSIQNYISNACICFYKKKSAKLCSLFFSSPPPSFLTWSQTCDMGLSCKHHRWQKGLKFKACQRYGMSCLDSV